MSDDLAFRRLLDDAGADDAIRSRARRGARRSLRSADATLTGLLGELTRCHAPVIIDVGGHPMVGRVAAVTTTALTLVAARTIHTVRLAAITTIRTVDLESADAPVDATFDTPTGSSWAAVVQTLLHSGDAAGVLVRGSIEHGVVLAASDELVQLRVGTSRVAITTSSLDAVSMSEPGSIRHD